MCALAERGYQCQSRATSLTCDNPLLVRIIDFPSLGTCPADLAAHLLPLEWPQVLTPHEQDQRRPWHARIENTAYFSISL